MANNQLAVYQSLVFGDLTEQDIVTIRETVGKDCNESQFKLFMAISKSSSANPVLNEIYPAVRGGQLTVQFGIDFYVRKAKETDGYLGYDVQLVHENDEFKMHQEKDEDGRYFIVIDEHAWGFPRGKVIGGYAIAYKEGLKPFTVIMEVDEVEHYKRSNIGMQKTMWTNNFNDMFKKHMVRRALKAAFGLNFDDGDVGNKGQGQDNFEEYKPNQRKDITPDVNETQQPKPESKPEQDTLPEEDPSEKLKTEIKAKFKKLGITNAEARGAFLEKNDFSFKKPSEPTVAEMTGLVQLLDLHIDMEAASASDADVLE